MPSEFIHKISAIAQYASGQFGKDLAQQAEHRPVTAVLCYHRVTVDSPVGFSEIEAGVPAKTFERQMQFMLKHFRPIAAADVLDDTSPGLRFAVTFDDGTKDGLEVAAPILDRLGISGTFYAVHDVVGSDQVFWWEELAGMFRKTSATSADLAAAISSVVGGSPFRGSPYSFPSIASKLDAHKEISKVIRRGDPAYVPAVMDIIAEELNVPRQIEGRAYPLMDWEDLQTLVQRGHDIGGHSATHPNLALLQAGLLEKEVATSTQLIEGKIQAPVRSFAYPYGMIRTPVSEVGQELSKCANVRLAFGTGPGLIVDQEQERWALPRCDLTRDQELVWAHNINKAARNTDELSAA